MKRNIIIKELLIISIILIFQLIYGINYNVFGTDISTTTSIEETMISPLSDCTYNGEYITQNISIMYNGQQLIEGVDYKVKYENHKDVGTATVIIEGCGIYEGTITRYFKITSKPINELTIKANTVNYTYTGTARKPSVLIYHGGKKLTLNKDYTLTYKNNVNVGTASVTIVGKENYTGTVTKNYKIVAKSIKSINVTVNNSDHTYTGKSRKASVNLYYNNVKLVLNKDYTLAYKNTVNTGVATVTIKGKGNYTGTIQKTYRIVPKTPTIKSVIMNTKHTQATITWKKDTQASGYAIYKATSKNGEYKRIKTITSKNTTKYVAKKLNTKKTYYFKIKAYKTINKKKAYSKNYSPAKTNTGLLAKITLTSTSSSKNRNTNLKMASKLINGMVLKPGQTFNWFKVVGRTSAARGFKTATVFVNKKAVPGMGGGICQVSTTLYQAAKKAGLKIVERHTHSLPVTYTQKGKDATVAYGVKNLRIKNNKKYAVKLVTTSSGGKTTCKIYKVNY